MKWGLITVVGVTTLAGSCYRATQGTLPAVTLGEPPPTLFHVPDSARPQDYVCVRYDNPDPDHPTDRVTQRCVRVQALKDWLRLMSKG